MCTCWVAPSSAHLGLVNASVLQEVLTKGGWSVQGEVRVLIYPLLSDLFPVKKCLVSESKKVSVGLTAGKKGCCSSSAGKPSQGQAWARLSPTES